MHEVAQRASERATKSRGRLVLNHILNSRGKKGIDICRVGSGVKYHSLSYWSIVMMSPVEFSTGEFRAKRI